MIICDVWGGEFSQQHLARYVLSVDDALVWAKQELADGYLINLRADIAFGELENFDTRTPSLIRSSGGSHDQT